VTKTRLLVAAGVLVVAAAVLAVLAFPAWSASRGDDARWVVDTDATKVIDYDDERVLVLNDGVSLTVLDRETGEASRAGMVDFREGAALVPGGVVASYQGTLALTGPDGRVVWEKQKESRADPVYELAAVDVDAGVVVAEVGPEYGTGPTNLMGFALADGAPVWTMPDVAEFESLHGIDSPARRPGWFRTTTLLPVVRIGGYAPGTATEPTTWNLVSAATGEVTAEVREGGGVGRPVAVGDVAVRTEVPNCADLEIIGGPEVRWAYGPPAGECDLVWKLDPDRVLLTSWADQNATEGGDDPVKLHSLALRTGKVTEIDWTGAYIDTIVDATSGDLNDSWGRYLRSRGVIYDTETGAARWRGELVWLAGDTAVIGEPVTGLDRLASGAEDDSRWLRVADAATGEVTDSGYLAATLREVQVLDQSQAIVLTGSEAALIG
jgi:hypothetical protein